MNYYEILGIEKNAGIDEIRAAYSAKVKEFHPEDDPEGFMRIREAYKELVRLASAKISGFPAPPLNIPAQKTPPPPSFSFSDIKGDKSERKEETPPSVFNFSEIKGEKAERKEETPPLPDFNFSEIKGEKTERKEETPPPDFNFSELEQAASLQYEREKEFADDFTAQAMALYRSRKCKKASSWRDFFSRYNPQKLKSDEHFTWAFLDFLSLTPGIPSSVRLKVLDSYTAELRSFWQGTPLWGEFDVAIQKYTSKGLKKASRVFLTQIVFITLPLLVLIVSFATLPAFVTSDKNDAFGLMTKWYQGSVLTVISLVATAVIPFAAQLICNIKIMRIVNRGVSGKAKISNSRVIFIFVALISSLFFISAFFEFKKTTEYYKDLNQIENNLLSEDVFYIYRNNYLGEPGDTTIFVTSVSGNYTEHLLVPEGLEFNPGESSLLNVNKSVETNIENGMKTYRMTFTDNYKVVVSIEELSYVLLVA